jgi:hypothetical protein
MAIAFEVSRDCCHETLAKASEERLRKAYAAIAWLRGG